jgi:hypothetical protein
MSRELLQQCLDLITELDKEGVVCELGLILELRNALGVPDKLKMKAELAKPEQEPVAWMVRDQVDGCRYPSALKNPAGSINGESQPLYTAPPRKPWVGLTDAQISLMISSHISLTDMCRAIEAKLKEKNDV